MALERKMIRVLLADDFPLVRAGIRSLLSHTGDIEVVGEASNGVEALSLAALLKPDVLLLDLEMPGATGIEVVQRLAAESPNVRVLVLSAHDDRYFIQEVMRLGVYGYLTKDESQTAIVEAVRGVSRGEQGWVSRRVSRQMSNWMRRSEVPPQGLTTREMQVLERLVLGKTNQAIAADLGISEKTVEKYLESILKKLGVTSRVEAAVLAVREGLLHQKVE